MMNYQQIVNRLDDFPTLPTIYSSLLEAISNPRSTVQDVADIISKDQSSSVKLLKVVNSSIYGFKTRVDTISQAIFLLGFNEVKNIILSLSVFQIFNSINSQSKFNVVDLWKHSIGVAVISRMLGVTLGIKNVENYFLSGLMHDIGKLVFFKLFPDEYSKAVDDAFNSNMKIKDAEKKHFVIDHDILGDLLAEKWKLPTSIRNCIKFHSNGSIDGKIDVQVACVHLANVIATIFELGNPGDEIIDEPNYQIWNELSFTENALIGSYEQIILQYEQSLSILTL